MNSFLWNIKSKYQGILLGVFLALCLCLICFVPVNAVDAVSRNVGVNIAWGGGVYSNGLSDNVCINDGSLGCYVGLPTSLGGTWGDTRGLLIVNNIKFTDIRILVIGGEFYGKWYPSGGYGMATLNPYAKEAARVVGYGSIPYKPMYYLTKENKDIARRLGNVDEHIPILYSW